MNVTKEQFLAEIERRKQERAEARKAAEDAERDTAVYVDPQDEVSSGSWYDYINGRKYRGKYRTSRSYEC